MIVVVTMSSSQWVNIIVNRDYFKYYMSAQVVWQVTILRSFQGIINN